MYDYDSVFNTYLLAYQLCTSIYSIKEIVIDHHLMTCRSKPCDGGAASRLRDSTFFEVAIFLSVLKTILMPKAWDCTLMLNTFSIIVNCH